MSDILSLVLIVSLVFAAVVMAVYVVGQYIATHVRVQQRIAAPAGGSGAPAGAPAVKAMVNALVSTYFNEKRFGVEGAARTKLRRDLINAGYFGADAIKYYIFVRLAAVVILPTGAYLLTGYFLSNYPLHLKLGLVGIVTALAVFLPDYYPARRHRKLQAKYRLTFPDMLDLMVVCVDAGLSPQAAFERISSEIMRQNRELGINLMVMGAEMRAGRSMIDALGSFANRLGLDEAQAFVAMLRQSVELGTDVADALRVFSDEMRDRRMLRAEERANQLPVKMVAPLGLCIFPVILMVALVPTIIRLISVFK